MFYIRIWKNNIFIYHNVQYSLFTFRNGVQDVMYILKGSHHGPSKVEGKKVRVGCVQRYLKIKSFRSEIH